MLSPVLSSRLVVLDTETTGLEPLGGHRILEIGCVELVGRRHTGNRFHVYLNPDRLVDQAAIEVHGLTNKFLAEKPRFADIVDDFVAFIKDAELIIHNAAFDVGFINHEFSLLDKDLTVEGLCSVFDTLALARAKHPGQRNSLDALCKRYNIDNSHRELHGALLDAEILAEVYLLLTGGGQSSLLEGIEERVDSRTDRTSAHLSLAKNRPPLTVIRCSPEELAEHQQQCARIEAASGKRLWQSD